MLIKLVQDVKRAPRSRNEFPGVTAYQPPELEKAINELNDAQMAVLGRLLAGEGRPRADSEPVESSKFKVTEV